jgi:hypothetical protein
MGVSTFIMVGLKGLWKGLTQVTKIYTATVWLASKAVAAWNLTLKFLRGTLLAVRMAAISAGIGFNLLSWPVMLIIGAIALLVAGCYLLIKHWDAVKAAVMNTRAFAVVAGWPCGLPGCSGRCGRPSLRAGSVWLRRLPDCLRWRLSG